MFLWAPPCTAEAARAVFAPDRDVSRGEMQRGVQPTLQISVVDSEPLAC